MAYCVVCSYVLYTWRSSLRECSISHMHRPLGQCRAEFTTCNLVLRTHVCQTCWLGEKNASALLAVESVGGKSINICRILCQKQCNCSPLNQQGVLWASSDETLLCRCLHHPQQGQQARDHRDDLRPELLVNS